MNEASNPYPSSGEILDGKYRIEKLLLELNEVFTVRQVVLARRKR